MAFFGCARQRAIVFFSIVNLSGWGALISNKRYLSESRLNEPWQGCVDGKLPLSKNGNASELRGLHSSGLLRGYVTSWLHAATNITLRNDSEE